MATPPPGESDAAWAAVELPLAADVIRRLLADPQLLLRLNPCLEFERLERLGGARLRLVARNESNCCRIDTEAETVTSAEQLVLRYANGIKRESRFRIEPAAGGSRLTLTETYATPVETASPPPEVDRSLLSWIAALRRHLERDARWGRIPGYRWLAERFWPSMAPRQRRVAWLIVWTTALEFVLFVGVLAIYLAAG